MNCCDVLIIGSGYGGAFAAAELAKSGLVVWVVERGREYKTGEFPESVEETVGHIRYSRGNSKPAIGNYLGLFDIRADDDCGFVLGNGLGGGSLINAGVVVAPEEGVYDSMLWPPEIRAQCTYLSELECEVRTLLGAQPYPGTRNFKKFQALEKLSEAIPGTRCEPAPIAVTSKTGPNAVGVHQKACIECGNCVTGCNYQAKNTLAMNVIPLAVARGAQFYTGATALSIDAAGQRVFTPNHTAARWCVRFAMTDALSTPEQAEDFYLHAGVVVVAAGALGSTEILMRSAAPLSCSRVLGQRINGNGDMLAFGFAQRKPVDSSARLIDTDKFARVGPTIVGMIKRSEMHSPMPARALIEDGSIPYSLAPFMGALLGSVGLAYVNTHDELPAFYAQRPEQDPVGVHPKLVEHSQTILAMSAGDTCGMAWLDPHSKGPIKKMRVSLAATIKDKTTLELHEALKKAEGGWVSTDGFDGGYYVTNPLWRFLPDGFEEVGDDLDARMISVHPLGGCVMGTSCENGVVNHLGQVFRTLEADSSAVHEGLYVLDGAIVPTALGANPLLTISVLALRAARELAGKIGITGVQAQRACIQQVPAGMAALAHPPRRPRIAVHPPGQTELRFDELLYSRSTPAAQNYPAEKMPLGLKFGEAWLPVFAVLGLSNDSFKDMIQSRFSDQVAANHVEKLRDVLREPPVTREVAKKKDTDFTRSSEEVNRVLAVGESGLAIRFDLHCNLNDWVSDPSRFVWEGVAGMSTYQFGGGVSGVAQETGYWPRAGNDPNRGLTFPVRNGVPILGKAKVRLLARDKPRDAGDFLDRAQKALTEYGNRRQAGRDLEELNRRTKKSFPMPPSECWPDPALIETGDIVSNWNELGTYMRRAAMHSDWRELVYEACLECPDGDSGISEVSLYGRKLLAYAPGQKNIWDALIDIDMTLTINGGNAVTIPMRVDLLDLLRGNVYSFAGQSSSLETIARLIDVGALWFRALVSSQYWAFAGSDYTRRFDPPYEFKTLSVARLANGEISEPSVHTFTVPRSIDKHREGADGPDLTLRLSQYKVPGGRTKASPLLLIHGLAHGGELFATPSPGTSMVSYFLSTGREVWVLDHRLSNLLGDTCKLPGTLDDIACLDIPRAFSRVLESLPPDQPQKIDVFAHCVGAAAFAMSVLRGALQKVPVAGRLEPAERPVGRVALHSVHPWLVPSAYNRVSASLSALYRDALEDEVFDVYPPVSGPFVAERQPDIEGLPEESPTKVRTLDHIIDRIAASLPRSSKGDGSHKEESDASCSFSRAICNRLTLFYGPNWSHDNLTPETLEAATGILGPTHIDYIKQVFFCILRQRLTDHDGGDIYLSRFNMVNHFDFPVLFATGMENRVFAPRSAIKSWHSLRQLRQSERDRAARHMAPPPLAPSESHADCSDSSRVGSAGHSVAHGQRAALSPEPVSLYMPEETGHMDFVFGRSNTIHFKRLEHFFDDPAASQREAEVEYKLTESVSEGKGKTSVYGITNSEFQELTTPLCGPIFNYSVPAAGAAYELALHTWFELRPYGSARLFELGADKAAKALEAHAAGAQVSVSATDLRATYAFGDVQLPGRFLAYTVKAPISTLRAAGDSLAFSVEREHLWLSDLASRRNAAMPGKAELPPKTTVTVSSGSEMGQALRSRLADPKVEENPGAASAGTPSELFSNWGLIQNAIDAALKLKAEQRPAPAPPFSGEVEIRSAPPPAPARFDPVVLQGETASDIAKQYRAERDQTAIQCELSLNPACWLKRLPARLDPKTAPHHWTRLLVTSCRWPGLPVEQREINRILKRMLDMALGKNEKGKSVCPELGVDALFLLGDQVYVDSVANIIDVSESAERSAKRYREMFTGDVRYDERYNSHWFRAILQAVPTWMVIDDHEFSDNWSGWTKGAKSLSDKDRLAHQRRFAATVAYQWRRYDPCVPDANPSMDAYGEVLRGLWQPFQVGALPCFAMDTRSERKPASVHCWRDRTLFGGDQFRAFRDWLAATRHSLGPRFVLCGSAFGFLTREVDEDLSKQALSDDWLGFPKTMSAVCQLLLDEQASDVVFVCGDLHLSAMARITIDDGLRQVVVHSIVSSGLNATLPFANAKAAHFVASGQIPLGPRSPLRANTEIDVISQSLRQFGEIEVRPANRGQRADLIFRVHNENGIEAVRTIALPVA
ncbi:MAG: alkaline phosphatase D family protein [Burkholderiaceae bacterium]